jgi:hypothetical protein
VTQYLRLFSEWGGTKLDRMREAGYDVVVLDEGAAKEISGSDVREALRSGGDWESLVPSGVARVIRSLERIPVRVEAVKRTGGGGLGEPGGSPRGVRTALTPVDE